MINYGFTKEIDIDFNEAIKQTTEKLQKAGFGILTNIDIKEKFRQKLGIDFKKYVILGACDPVSAHKAIEVEENIGLMLPCNIIIYEKGEHVVISAIKPTAAMQMIDNPELNKIAVSVETKIKCALDDIQ